MPPIIHRFSYGLIIFALIALVSGPAFGAVVYFGNISDWPQTFPVGTMGKTSLKAGCLEAKAEPYRDYMTMSAQIVGLDAALIVAVTKQESDFRETVVSPAGAVGMMQMLPETFASLSTTYGKDYTGAYAAQKSAAGLPAPRPDKVITNPEYNIFLGSHYLRQAYDRYNHRLDLTLASYNAGPDNTHIRDKHVVPPYKETQDYVRIITASYNDYKSRCQENLTPAATASSNPSARGQTVADAAKKRLGEQSVCKFGAPANEGCTSFVKDILDTNAQTNFNLDAPKGWSQPEGVKTKGTNGIQPGDAVFWVVPDNNEFSTKDLNQTDFPPGTEVPSHVGIYIGDYTGPDYFDSSGNGKQVHYTNAVAANSSKYGRIVVRDLGLYPVYGYKRY